MRTTNRFGASFERGDIAQAVDYTVVRVTLRRIQPTTCDGCGATIAIGDLYGTRYRRERYCLDETRPRHRRAAAIALAYRRAQAKETTRRTEKAQEAQLSLLGPPAKESESRGGYALDTRGNEPIDRPQQPTSGRMHRAAKPTEAKAAHDIAVRSGTQRAAVLMAIVDAGYRGMTQWEIVETTEILRSSVCARVNELEAATFVESAGERISSRNTSETVYRATSRAIRWAKGASA